jgi:hypothetical protein
MGDDRVGGAHTVLNPNMVATLARLDKRLGGESHAEENFPQHFGKCEGFECQLLVLQVLLRAELFGSINSGHLESLKYAADRQKTNPLAQFALHAFTDGDQSSTTDLLMNLPRYPANHLPTSADVCDPWPVQRDDDSESLKPCPEEGRRHSGGDFLFVAWLLERGTEWQSK